MLKSRLLEEKNLYFFADYPTFFIICDTSAIAPFLTLLAETNIFIFLAAWYLLQVAQQY